MDDRHGRRRTPTELWEKLKPLARQMRHQPTPAENLLWQQLRNHKLGGAKFRRQHAIERFIVDFYCHEANLVIEVDGAIHDYTADEDAVRQAWLEAQGLRVLRFRNDEIMSDIARVLGHIRSAL